MEYLTLLRKVEDILSQKGYEIIKSIEGFYLVHGETKISEITIHVTTGNVLIGKTRTSYSALVEKDVFNISWLSTHKQYEGQQLGTLLIIYALCQSKATHPHVNYAVLDDDSDKSTSMKNIYTKLGFSFREFVHLGDRGVEISGPEKQLELNDDFIRRVTRKLYPKRRTKKYVNFKKS